MSEKHVYYFGDGSAEGKTEMKNPARRQGRQPGRDDPHRPAGAPRLHHHHRGLHLLLRPHKTYPKACRARSRPHRQHREDHGRKFGDAENPLLVAVRSGARDSMPGMMDTVLNLGLNDETVEGLARHRQRALRLGLLPPLHPDVRRRRDGRAEAPRRGSRALRGIVIEIKTSSTRRASSSTPS
jgi:hypothetical protein